MRITIAIEIPGADGESVSLITSPGAMITGQPGSETGGREHNAGQPPADLVQRQGTARGDAAGAEGWTDAGSAPEPPADASGESGGSHAGMDDVEDVGGPPDVESGHES